MRLGGFGRGPVVRKGALSSHPKLIGLFRLRLFFSLLEDAVVTPSVALSLELSCFPSTESSRLGPLKDSMDGDELSIVFFSPFVGHRTIFGTGV